MAKVSFRTLFDEIEQQGQKYQSEHRRSRGCPHTVARSRESWLHVRAVDDTNILPAK